MIKNVINITDSHFGGKATGLKKLNDLDVSVPEAFVIDQEFISELLDNDKDSSEQLKQMLLSVSSNQFAVRSSAANEDGKENSFAGMYESVLNVPNTIEDIIKAIKQVYNSASSDRINNYSNVKGEMNVVIQRMITPDLAGVCFTTATDLNGDDVALIEYVNGLGEKLVSGKETAKNIIVKLKDFSWRTNGDVSESEISELLLYLKKIIEKTKEPLDIEWCICDKKAYFVQARPITKQIIIRPETQNGAIASSGSCEGNIYIIDEDETDEKIKERIDNFIPGSVLLAKTTDTNYVPAMKFAVEQNQHSIFDCEKFEVTENKKYNKETNPIG